MLAWKIAPALATGNTVVLKPAETTPLSALFFADICRQAGLPKGVVNILTGYGDAGAALVEHPDVNKVAFTGSTAVGKAIARQVAGTDKKVTLELGGKGANIVFDDAPIDQAVEGIVTGIFFNQGQVCCAGSRLLVQESVQDELLDSLKRRLSTLRLGDPLDKNTDIGAINSAGAARPDHGAGRDGRGGGRRALVRRRANSRRPATGSPRRCSRTSPRRTPIARDEIFGPVLSVLTFRTPDEAVAKANNSQYGLSAGIWTEKGSRILAVANKLRAGVVWANTFNKFDPTSPFGGYKESGFGREGGRHGLEAYLAPSSPEGDVDKHEHADRLSVFKTYKLYVGGKFPRSESGRVYEVTDSKGKWLANAPQSSRKDARDAVVAARKAFGGWSGATAYNRGQILYRVAEMLEGRRDQFVREVADAEGLSKSKAAAVVDAAIDRWVWYAGWTDKIGQIVGGANPVAGPFFNLSTPEPTGVVTVARPAGVVVPGPGLGGRPGDRDRQHGGRHRVSATPRCRRCPWARCWPPPTCRAVW